MPCYFCSREKVSIESIGECSICNVSVCSAPPKRPDKRIHGDICRCGCGKLICKPHASRHSQNDHGKQTIDCFRNFSGSLGGGTLFQAARLLSSSDAPTLSHEDVETFNEFLNCAHPGAAALSSLLEGRDPLGLWSIETEYWGEVSEIFVAFTPEFYSLERVTIVFALAAQTLGRVINSYGEKAVIPLVEKQLEPALAGLARWAAGDSDDEDLERLAQQLTRNGLNEQGVRTLVEVFRRGVPSFQPSDVANWILQAQAITLMSEVAVEV